jgi:hypothetical protein
LVKPEPDSLLKYPIPVIRNGFFHSKIWFRFHFLITPIHLKPSSYLYILIFSVGQTAITAQQVKKTNKRPRKSKFKNWAGENHVTKYFTHKGSGGGLVGGTKTKAGEIVSLEHV